MVLPLVSPFLIWRGAFQNLCRQHSPALYTEYSVPTKLFQKKKEKTKEEKNTKKLPEQKSGQEEQIRKSIERLPEMVRYCLKRAELKFDEKEKATTFTFPEECILEKQNVIDHKELIEKSVHAQIIV